MSKADWVIESKIQDAIKTYASLTWEMQDIESEITARKKLLEELDDALAEFDIENSWIGVGESFYALADYSDMSQDLELRQKDVQKNMDALSEQLHALQEVADKKRNMIELALGDRVRLNMDS